MKIKLVFLIVLTMTLATLCGAGVNECSNPNFELDGNGDLDLTARPISDCIDWTEWGGGTADEVQPADDHPTARMMAVPGSSLGQATTIVAEAATVYYLEVDIKSTTGSATAATLYFEDSGYNNDVELAIDIPATGWQRFTHTLDTSEATAYVGGTFWFGIRSSAGIAMTNVYMGVGTSDSGPVSSPYPQNGETVIPGALTLSWEHYGTGTNNIYWNNGAADVNTANFDPLHSSVVQIGAIDQDANYVSSLTTVEEKNYFWRVDNGGEVGPVWSFTTINAAPDVDAGPKQAKWLPNGGGSVIFQLAPTVSDDGLPVPPGTIASYLWTDSGPGSVVYDPPGGATEAPTATMTVAGDYTLTLTVNDGALDGSDTVLLRVFDFADEGLLARYDCEEDDTEAGIHDDYSGAKINPIGSAANPIYSNGTRRGERMNVVGSIPADRGLDTTTMLLDGGHNTDEQDLGDITKGGIQFDGEAGHVYLANSDSDPNMYNPDPDWVASWADLRDEVTIMAWIKVDPDTGWDNSWETIIAKGWDSSIDDGAYAVWRNGNADSLQMSAYGVTPRYVNGTAAVNDGEWHHVAGTYDGVELCMYVDGLKDACVETDGAQINLSDAPLTVGESYDPANMATYAPFGGVMDEIRINSIGIPWNNAQAGAVDIVQIYRDSGGHMNCGGNYLPGDANEDCYVDLKDVKTMVEEWLDCTSIDRPNCDGYWR